MLQINRRNRYFCEAGVEYPALSWFSRRQAREPPVENGLIPYLGCALQFGANPLQFLRSREKKYGPIFTCKIAGQYIHFLCDPFSYHSVIRQGRHLDWRKFHFATSVKVRLWDPFFAGDGEKPHHSPHFSNRRSATTASTPATATPLRTCTRPF